MSSRARPLWCRRALATFAACAAVASTAGGCRLGAPRGACGAHGPIETVCGFQNPEDVEYVARAGIVLVANMHGHGDDARSGFLAAFEPDTGDVFRLWPAGGARGVASDVASDVALEDALEEALQGEPAAGDAAPDAALGDPACTEPPDPDAFSPHGITARSGRDRSLVFVVAHARADGRGREAIEVFALEGRGLEARLTWKACIPTPGSVQANDLAVTRDGEIVASNYRPDASFSHTAKASLLGTQTGDLIAWTAERGWRHVEGTEAALPNGVAVGNDGATIFYTESATGRVHRLPRNGGGGAIAVEVEGSPDNLAWSRRGTLLTATHTDTTALGACLLGWLSPCTTGWALLEIDPATLAVKVVLEHDGEALGAVSSVTQVGDRLVLGSVFDDRIGIVRVR